jgi:hypothetical protein
MLASILPGLRDFRTPFATGMLWLTVAWLWFGLQPPEEIPLSGPLREVYLASSAVGVTTTLAVVGFIAYLIGLALSFRLTLRRSDLRFVSS